MLAAGLTRRFPAYPAASGDELPSCPAMQQLLSRVIAPGVADLASAPLIAEYVERFLQPLGCVEIAGAHVCIVSPPWALLQPVLDLLAAEPVRMTDIIPALRRPPYGLLPEQARLLLWCAVRAGSLRGLDSFLQPLDPEDRSLSLGEALVFVAAPELAAEADRPLVQALAAHWGIPTEPWTLACSRVAHAVRHWMASWPARVPGMRAALQEWTALFDVPPWGWTQTTGILDRLEPWAALPNSLEALLEPFANAGVELVAQVETLWKAVGWWQKQQDGLCHLQAVTLPEALRAERQALVVELAAGEAAFPRLPELEQRLAQLASAFQDAYQDWHRGVFGPDVVAALRRVFDGEAFKAVKWLARLPLPWPPAAEACLGALQQARTHYCPGEQMAVDGCCARCRRAFGSPSPMPDPEMVARQAEEGLAAYAALMATHPWVATTAARIARAPETLASRAQRVLNWHGDPAEILALMDEALLAWLLRDHPTTGVRVLGSLQRRLAGKDLTLAEAREAVCTWLDPEGALADDAVLAFE
jgi:hypothetical protein